jgi:predicted GH43/DUF377 family glycosyl hydrolase
MVVKSASMYESAAATLERHNENPKLLPNEDTWWESEAVFNPAVLYDGNKVHMLYRAIGEYEHYVSRFGYACSTDGFNFERLIQFFCRLVISSVKRMHYFH